MSLKHADIIAKMDLEQKCALLSGASAFGTRAYPKLGIPELQFSDGPHGMRHQDPNVANHLGIGGSMPATCFPTAVTVADSWDPKLGEELGEALGEEAAAQGVGVVLGPGLCIKRSPLCGRDFEYFSEDPLLAGKMAAGYVRGIQVNGLGACPKHFAVNSQETRRQASDSVLDERTLREIYLTAFEIVVRESHPKSIMSSYNLVNGTYANDNERLLSNILRGEWGFDGAVVTDWGGSNDHAAGVAAGSTFEMPSPGLDSVRRLVGSVECGETSVHDVDARVDEAIDLVLSTRTALEGAPDFDKAAHHDLARRIAAAGIVLLKNEAAPVSGDRPLLPLAAGTRVALVGDFAKTPRYQGAGSSLVNTTKLDTLVDGIAGSGLDCVGYEQGFVRTGDGDAAEDARLREAAVSLAGTADVVLVCLGLDELAESEGIDRADMRLNANQVDLLHAVAEKNPNVVVLLSAGSSVETGWTADAASVLYLALGGQAGASAALDVLMGRTNPSGKLAETWARSLADTACASSFPSDDRTAEYREGIYVGYRYYQKAGVDVAYPFGYGLSYTTFAYANVAATPDEVSFDITNTGAVAGAEVAQVYVSKPDARVFRPVRELKGFAKVALDPGETRRVTVPLDERAFRYFNQATGAWEVEGGSYVIEVAASCEDVRLTAEVSVAGTDAPNPYQGLDLTCYDSGQVQDVPDAQFAVLLGHQPPNPKVTIDRNICFRDLGHSRSPIFWVVAAVLRGAERASARSGRRNLNIEFIYNMPMRGLAKNAGDVVSMGLVDALVRELKGWGLAGIVPALLVQ
ncbi:MAG: glycoside hydrolase family 3 C-terminal domain-containing protein, partial [Atopobiaceae bacterium]|nr:glycoside hydrolase family 3 C-terminal domain-containing protein [Atopobiaceae bacterium]